MTKYVFIDCSASTQFMRETLLSHARLHDGDLWGFSTTAWPINNPADIRKGNEGTNVRAVLDVVGDAPTMLFTDGELGEFEVPFNVTVVSVKRKHER